MLIGLISDTHGLMRPEALARLAGSELIIHAGDVGAPGILDELAKIAPVKAIRGNIDTAPWCRRLPKSRIVEAEDASIYVIHNIEELDIKPAAAGMNAVVFGHSHKPLIELREGVLFVNPGSAGARRFRLPVTVARMKVEGRKVEAESVALFE